MVFLWKPLQKEHKKFQAFFPFSFVQKSCSRSCSLVLPSVQKSCCFGAPLRAKIVLWIVLLVFSSVQKPCSKSCFLVWAPWKLFSLRAKSCCFGAPLVHKSCSRSCSLVFSSVQKSCSSLWKLLQTMGQTQYIYIYIWYPTKTYISSKFSRIYSVLS